MIIHLDSDKPKPIEQKVEEVILKKLYIKSDNPKVTVDKNVFANYMFVLIKGIAEADYDLERAVELALPNNSHLDPDLIYKQYEAALNEFSCEVDAYATYIEYNNEHYEEDEIMDAVYFILNSDDAFLERRLAEIIGQSLDNIIHEDGFSEMMGFSRKALLESAAFQIKVIASNDNILEAIEEFAILTPTAKKLQGAELKAEIEKVTKFSEVAHKEISAYKMALSLQSQNAEISMILATTKQLLNLQ